jgi:hypothetical protein
VGAEVASLVVVLSPWMLASVGVNVTFPLIFVADRTRALPSIALALLAGHVALAWVASELLGLFGLALALALSTALALGGLVLALGILREAARGIVSAAGVVAALTVAAFVPPWLVLGPFASAASGLALYALLVGLVRPRELRASWEYLRDLS